MEDIDIFVEEPSDVNITIDTNTAYVIEVPGVSAASILTTKGDLLGHSTLPVRVPVGTDDYVLTADSTENNGIKWAAIPTPETNKIFEGNSSVEVDDIGFGEILFTIDGNKIIGINTLTQPILIQHSQTFLGNNTPLVLIDVNGTATSNKGAALWVGTNRGSGSIDIDVFKVYNADGDLISIDNGGFLYLSIGAGINEFSIDGTLADNSDTALPTEKAVKTYVDTQVSGIDPSPLTTKGDIWVYGSDDTRLPIGTDDYVLTADSSEATGMKWAASTGGFSDPMTTRGDIIYRNSSNTTTRLAAGSANQVLTSDGTDIAWSTVSGAGVSDKIEEGDTSVEVVDAGSGYILFNIDGNEIGRIDNGGTVRFGDGTTESYFGVYYMVKEDNSPVFGGRTFSSTSAVHAPRFEFGRTRGTIASPSALNEGDRIGALNTLNYDGSGYQYTAGIIFKNDGAVSTGVAPGKIEFETSATNTGGRTARLRITSSGTVEPGADNSQDLGSSSYRWNDIYATNSTIQTSDERLKDNIEHSDLGLDFINSLEPKSFKWKDNTVSGTKEVEVYDDKGELIDLEKVDYVEEHKYHRKHYGMIAQDVITTLSGIGITTEDFAGVIYDEKTDRYGLRYQEFIAPLIKSVQELSNKNNDLEARIEHLEALVNTMVFDGRD